MELKELSEKVLQLFEISNIDELGEKLFKCVETNDIDKFEEFEKLVIGELSKDWLQLIYQYYCADRKDKKQDYTPKCLAQFLSRLVGESSETIDMCGGSGALTIQRWSEYPDTYFTIHEIDHNVIPYLLFNLCLRNITADVFESDVLHNETKTIYSIRKGEKYGKVFSIKSPL